MDRHRIFIVLNFLLAAFAIGMVFSMGGLPALVTNTVR
jgi:hypothetical protein